MSALQPRYRDIQLNDRGVLCEMLRTAYAPLLESAAWQTEADRWDQFDAAVFDHIDTIGRCVFITETSGHPVGFMSYDPRESPASARLGHNCILPDHQGRGLGAMQLREALRRLASVKTLRVSTGEQPFFAPARRMYAAAGFVGVGRHAGGPDPAYGVIEYELNNRKG